VDLRNYIHVGINYRLATLGFLSLEGLRQENSYRSTGNYGLQDQQLALKFIRDNIAGFGGDPARVTLFGEGTGGDSICWHLVSPGSQGLFHSAIMQSGNCDTSSNYYTVDQAVEFGKQYARLVGCVSSDDKQLVACMRALPPAQLLSGWAGMPTTAPFVPKLWPVMPWGPAIDGTIVGLLDLPLKLIKEGKFNRVPVVVGTNENEGNIFIPLIPYIVNNTEFPLDRPKTRLALLHFFNSTLSDELLDLYQNAGPTWESCLAFLMRDWAYACPSRRLAAELSKSVATYLYHFTYIAPGWQDQWLLGDYHGSELEFVFNNAWPPPERVFSPQDKFVVGALTAYWDNMAFSLGSPNTPGAIPLQWPRYNPVDESILNVRLPFVIDKHYLFNRCTFWDKVQ